jgi:ribosomal protein L7/L12
VAVKALHPRVAATLARDLAPAAAASRLASLWSPGAAPWFADVRARLLAECDYAREAQRQERFAALFAGHPSIVVPAVHRAWSSPRVLTTTFVAGAHLDAHLARGARRPHSLDGEHARAAGALFDLYVGALLVHDVCHCDPHPGNYLFLADGRVAVLDFGCVAELPPGTAARLGRLVSAAGADDEAGVHRVLVELHAVADAQRYDRRAATWLLRAFLAPLLGDRACAFDVPAAPPWATLQHLWRARAIAPSPELPYLLRTLVGLSAVLGRLGARDHWGRRVEALARPSRQRAHGSGPDAASDAPAPPPPSATTTDAGTWDLVLLDPGAHEITVLRELRELTGLDLSEVKHLIDASPRAIRHALPRAVAESLRARLESAGARVEVRPSTGDC